MSEKAIKNNELLKSVSADLSSISQDIKIIKEGISEINYKLTKINNIEDKLKKGEKIQKSSDGWFIWS